MFRQKARLCTCVHVSEPVPSTSMYGTPTVYQPPFRAPGMHLGRRQTKGLLSCWQRCGGGVGPNGLGRCGGQGQAVWGHYLRASEQGCVCVCVSMSGWMGVSMCALGDHIRVGTLGGSVGRCHLDGCAGQYVSMATWRFGWKAVCLEWGLGSGGFCLGGIV